MEISKCSDVLKLSLSLNMYWSVFVVFYNLIYIYIVWLCSMYLFFFLGDLKIVIDDEEYKKVNFEKFVILRVVF